MTAPLRAVTRDAKAYARKPPANGSAERLRGAGAEQPLLALETNYASQNVQTRRVRASA